MSITYSQLHKFPILGYRVLQYLKIPVRLPYSYERSVGLNKKIPYSSFVFFSFISETHSLMTKYVKKAIANSQIIVNADTNNSKVIYCIICHKFNLYL